MSTPATADIEETGEESDVPALAAALFRDFFEPDLFDEGVPAEGIASRSLYNLGAGRSRQRRNLVDAPMFRGPRGRMWSMIATNRESDRHAWAWHQGAAEALRGDSRY